MSPELAEQLTLTFLQKYNLPTWNFRLIHSTKFLGRCAYHNQEIQIAKLHLETHTNMQIIDTILHEIAHALTPGHGHDEVWQAKCREIGALAEARADDTFAPYVKEVEVICLDCNRVVARRHRAPSKNLIHGNCRDRAHGGKLTFRRVKYEERDSD
jgi:predicted SprT family Zn-dependent metalloprotease